MKTDKLINFMKMGNITIPLYLIKNYKQLNIEAEEVIILSYLLDKNSIFDCQKIGEDLNLDHNAVLKYINGLQEKGLLSICIEKNSKGIVEEYLSFEPFYNKLSLLVIDTTDKKETVKSNVYEIFEKELGRTLSPMEYEIIVGWLDSKYSEELIVEALKEAVYNGANNLRYIDKILFEWQKKGLKKISDVHKDRDKFVKNKNTPIELPDYNWLEDNE